MHAVVSSILSQSSPYGANGGPSTFVLLVEVALLVAMFAGYWKTFQKAGEPGWYSIVPIWNAIVLLKIAGKPVWWLIGLLVPCVNVVVLVLVGLAVAQRFGKSQAFGIGLGLLPFIFYPVLGFSDARYSGGGAPVAPLV